MDHGKKTKHDASLELARELSPLPSSMMAVDKTLQVHTVSYTPLDAPGGVPRFNRYIRRVIEESGLSHRHWSWWDFPDHGRYGYLPENEKAVVLSRYLIHQRLVDRHDVIIGDGFWCGDFSRMGFRRVISVAHGIWGHVTKDDVDRGISPENPELNAAQIAHRLDHQGRGLPIVSVSRFIQDQMRWQWEIASSVINNAIDEGDLDISDEDDGWWQRYEDSAVNRPIVIVHGINDRSNTNKGISHIEAVERAVKKENFPLQVMIGSLDELVDRMGVSRKMNVLKHADLAVIPSGFEGNSYWALELLAAGVPVVAYDVGLFWEISRCKGADWIDLDELDGNAAARKRWVYDVGVIAPRDKRSEETTAALTLWMLKTGRVFHRDMIRGCLRKFSSFEQFKQCWIEKIKTTVLFDNYASDASHR